jgi:hypothetical protein
LKANQTDSPFKTAQQNLQDEGEALVQGIEECLREVRDLSSSVAQADEPEPSSVESEDEGVFPMPEECQESSSPQYETVKQPRKCSVL